MPAIEIRNYTESKTVDYRTTITFTADVTNAVPGGTVHWFVDGADVSEGESFTRKEAKKSYTVQAKYMKNGTPLAESSVEKINVKTGFFAKLKAFFRALFGKLPKQVQTVFKADPVVFLLVK